MITGINHITFAVQNIERSFMFYKDILGFKPLCKSEGSAYLLAGSPENPGCVWVALDLDRENLRNPSPCYSHVAFSVTLHDFDAMAKRIQDSRAFIFKDNTSPGHSLYFLDPDDHKLEIHTGTWQSRLEAKKQNPGNWTHVEWFI